MEPLESTEDYLEAILRVKEKQNYVRSVDVAKLLNVSKPSVTYATKRLRESGYITIDENNHLHLTELGMNVANKIYERHKILTHILEKLGVDSENAENDACRLEHDLSDASWNAIKRYYTENFNK